MPPPALLAFLSEPYSIDSYRTRSGSIEPRSGQKEIRSTPFLPVIFLMFKIKLQNLGTKSIDVYGKGCTFKFVLR